MREFSVRLRTAGLTFSICNYVPAFTSYYSRAEQARVADYLVVKGMPFRDAYNVSGRIVSYCLGRGCPLEELPLDEFRAFSDLIEDDIYQRLDLRTCMEKRNSAGGTSPDSVRKQIEYIRSLI